MPKPATYQAPHPMGAQIDLRRSNRLSGPVLHSKLRLPPVQQAGAKSPARSRTGHLHRRQPPRQRPQDLGI